MRIVIPVVVAALAAACAPATTAGDVQDVQLSGDPAGNGSDVVVSVENDRPQTMRVFATRENMRFLVGEVPGRGSGTFALPEVILHGDGPLRLEADPRGSTQVQESEPIELTDGKVVEWRLRSGGGERVWVQ